MIFSLAVYAPPYSSEASDTAYRFAEAALKSGHTLYRVFFYHDGVYNSSALHCPPQDEANRPEQWRALAEAHDIDLVVCIATALKRGLLNESEASRYDKTAFNVANRFDLSGLGQLIDAAQKSDRLVSFG
jgi:tRNA 2-thiouridine synthesizing protein D